MDEKHRSAGGSTPVIQPANEKARLWPFSLSLGLVIFVGAASAAGTILVVLQLIGELTISRQTTISTKDLLEIVRLAFFGSAGIGGIVALLVAYRRQRIAEASHILASTAQEFDAAMKMTAHRLQEEMAVENQRNMTEKRITDIYTATVEQLGSPHAPVRLGAVYSLERLGEGNPLFRQTSANVICAYLRLPYTPKGHPPHRPETRTSDELHRVIEETHVRLAIQQVLQRHLVPPEGRLPEDKWFGPMFGKRERRIYGEFGYGPLSPDTDREAKYWPNIHLDFRYATLLMLDLRGTRVASIDCRDATFVGRTHFSGMNVQKEASFVGARFHGHTGFR